VQRNFCFDKDVGEEEEIQMASVRDVEEQYGLEFLLLTSIIIPLIISLFLATVYTIVKLLDRCISWRLKVSVFPVGTYINIMVEGEKKKTTARVIQAPRMGFLHLQDDHPGRIIWNFQSGKKIRHYAQDPRDIQEELEEDIEQQQRDVLLQSV